MERRVPEIQITPFAYVSLAFGVILLPFHWCASCLMAIIIHETGHLITALLCGAKVHKISITAIGANIEIDGLPYGKKLIASLAGPAAGFSLLLIGEWFPLTSAFAFVHSLFNLLPLSKFDGSNALFSGLCLLFAPNKAEKICRGADVVTRILLCSLCFIFAWKLTWSFGGILGVLLLIRLKRNPCKRSTLQVQ